MNKKLRNLLIALAVIIGIGLVIKFGFAVYSFWGVWHQPVFKLW